MLESIILVLKYHKLFIIKYYYWASKRMYLLYYNIYHIICYEQNRNWAKLDVAD